MNWEPDTGTGKPSEITPAKPVNPDHYRAGPKGWLFSFLTRKSWRYMEAEFAKVLRAEFQTEWEFGYSNAAAEITHRYLSRPDTDESVKQYEDEMRAARKEWKREHR